MAATRRRRIVTRVPRANPAPRTELGSEYAPQRSRLRVDAVTSAQLAQEAITSQPMNPIPTRPRSAPRAEPTPGIVEVRSW